MRTALAGSVRREGTHERPGGAARREAAAFGLPGRKAAWRGRRGTDRTLWRVVRWDGESGGTHRTNDEGGGLEPPLSRCYWSRLATTKIRRNGRIVPDGRGGVRLAQPLADFQPVLGRCLRVVLQGVQVGPQPRPAKPVQNGIRPGQHMLVGRLPDIHVDPGAGQLVDVLVRLPDRADGPRRYRGSPPSASEIEGWRFSCRGRSPDRRRRSRRRRVPGSRARRTDGPARWRAARSGPDPSP